MRIITTIDDIGLMIIMMIWRTRCEIREQDIDESKLDFCLDILEEGDPEFEDWFLSNVLPHQEDPEWVTPAIELM